jgi:hypothetical protein
LTNTTDAPVDVALTCAAVLGEIQSAQPLDLMERPAGEVIDAEDGGVSVTVPANGLGTWLIRTT